MIAANVGTGERPCVCFVDAGFEVLGCQDKVLSGCELAHEGHTRLLS